MYVITYSHTINASRNTFVIELLYGLNRFWDLLELYKSGFGLTNEITFKKVTNLGGRKFDLFDGAIFRCVRVHPTYGTIGAFEARQYYHTRSTKHVKTRQTILSLHSRTVYGYLITSGRLLWSDWSRAFSRSRPFFRSLSTLLPIILTCAS